MKLGMGTSIRLGRVRLVIVAALVACRFAACVQTRNMQRVALPNVCGF